MKVIRVGKNNSTFQQLLAIKENREKRTKTGLFFVEGVQSIKNALAYDWEIEAFIYSNYSLLSRWATGIIDKAKYNYILDEKLMKTLCTKSDTSEILAIIKKKETNGIVFGDNPVYVLIDRPSKKGNLGTIIRSCDAFGVSEIFYSGHSVDLYDPAVITATMGSFFKIPISFVETNDEYLSLIKRLKERYSDISVVATSLQSQKPIYECFFSCPVLLLIGNEADGLRRVYMESADVSVKIPMRTGIDSLNVACATTTCLYEIYKQRVN